MTLIQIKKDNKTLLPVTLFLKSEISRWMHAFDLDDSGCKVFGDFMEGFIEVNKPRKVNKTYIQNLIENIMKEEAVVYVTIANCYYGISDESIKMLSTGQKFCFVTDLVEKDKLEKVYERRKQCT